MESSKIDVKTLLFALMLTGAGGFAGGTITAPRQAQAAPITVNVQMPEIETRIRNLEIGQTELKTILIERGKRKW
jgi:hypothetical protein